jgi:DNA repair protein RadC
VKGNQNTDLVALVSRVAGCNKKVAGAIVSSCEPQSLNTLEVSQLVSLGCSVGQASRFRAAMRLGERVHIAQSARDAAVSVCTPTRAVRAIRDRFDIGSLEQEYFWAIALDSRQKVLDVFTVAIGSLAEVNVHPRELFKPLVRMSAHSCLLAHNHPSNDASPSGADIELTVRMQEVGRMLGIPVLDSLVITSDDATSLAASGLIT